MRLSPNIIIFLHEVKETYGTYINMKPRRLTWLTNINMNLNALTSIVSLTHVQVKANMKPMGFNNTDSKRQSLN